MPRPGAKNVARPPHPKNSTTSVRALPKRRDFTRNRVKGPKLSGATRRNPTKRAKMPTLFRRYAPGDPPHHISPHILEMCLQPFFSAWWLVRAGFSINCPILYLFIYPRVSLSIYLSIRAFLYLSISCAFLYLRTVRGTVDDEEGEMRRRGARECEEVLMEATEARRGYARVAAWDEGNLIQAIARLKNPTIAWRYGDG